MKQFDLQKYLKNPNQKIVTRSGNSVRIICTDKNDSPIDESYPIVALVKNIDNSEIIVCYKSNGQTCCGKNFDLFFASISHECWTNLYKGDSKYYSGGLYNTKYEAKKSIINDLGYITTVKIEWEE